MWWSKSKKPTRYFSVNIVPEWGVPRGKMKRHFKKIFGRDGQEIIINISGFEVAQRYFSMDSKDYVDWDTVNSFDGFMEIIKVPAFYYDEDGDEITYIDTPVLVITEKALKILDKDWVFNRIGSIADVTDEINRKVSDFLERKRIEEMQIAKSAGG